MCLEKKNQSDVGKTALWPFTDLPLLNSRNPTTSIPDFTLFDNGYAFESFLNTSGGSLRMSCITHRADACTFCISDDLIEITYNANRMKAAILAVLEAETNKQGVGTWLTLSYADFERLSLGEYTAYTYRSLLNSTRPNTLQERGFISTRFAKIDEHGGVVKVYATFADWNTPDALPGRKVRQYLLHVEVVNAAIAALPARETTRCDPSGGKSIQAVPVASFQSIPYTPSGKQHGRGTDARSPMPSFSSMRKEA